MSDTSSRKRSSRASEDLSTLFTTLVADEGPLVVVRKGNKYKKIGTKFKRMKPQELLDLKLKETCDQLDYVKNKYPTQLSKEDIVVLKDGDMGPVTKIFVDGTFCLASRAVLYQLKDIACNISIIHPYEQQLNDRNRFWYAKTEVEVYSKSKNKWFLGCIDEVFLLKSEDASIVHPEKWFAVSYSVEGKTQYKQLPWSSQDLRPVAGTDIDTVPSSANSSCNSDDSILNDCESSCSSRSFETATTHSSFRNSCFE